MAHQNLLKIKATLLVSYNNLHINPKLLIHYTKYVSTCPVPHIQALFGTLHQTVGTELTWLLLNKCLNKPAIHWCILSLHLKFKNYSCSGESWTLLQRQAILTLLATVHSQDTFKPSLSFVIFSS